MLRSLVLWILATAVPAAPPPSAPSARSALPTSAKEVTVYKASGPHEAPVATLYDIPGDHYLLISLYVPVAMEGMYGHATYAVLIALPTCTTLANTMPPLS